MSTTEKSLNICSTVDTTQNTDIISLRIYERQVHQRSAKQSGNASQSMHVSINLVVQDLPRGANWTNVFFSNRVAQSCAYRNRAPVTSECVNSNDSDQIEPRQIRNFQWIFALKKVFIRSCPPKTTRTASINCCWFHKHFVSKTFVINRLMNKRSTKREGLHRSRTNSDNLGTLKTAPRYPNQQIVLLYSCWKPWNNFFTLVGDGGDVYHNVKAVLQLVLEI